MPNGLFNRLVDNEVQERLKKAEFYQAEQIARLSELTERLLESADHYLEALRLIHTELELLKKMPAPDYIGRRIIQIAAAAELLQSQSVSVDMVADNFANTRKMEAGPQRAGETDTQ